jgi:hypothetical protein
MQGEAKKEFQEKFVNYGGLGRPMLMRKFSLIYGYPECQLPSRHATSNAQPFQDEESSRCTK